MSDFTGTDAVDDDWPRRPERWRSVNFCNAIFIATPEYFGLLTSTVAVDGPAFGMGPLEARPGNSRSIATSASQSALACELFIVGMEFWRPAAAPKYGGKVLHRKCGFFRSADASARNAALARIRAGLAGCVPFVRRQARTSWNVAGCSEPD